ncbi:MAG: DUF1223 domain-containing protein [Motiliproteus sp.]|nr:DUF1223 domain-containing protein [Motiliproteus sp.]MCW9054046.1 DUF1223 domain-containing protein [Motiliproteus sp.]
MRKLALLSFLMLGPLLAMASEQQFVSKGQPPQLIELYTSEGCSSCPPADKKVSGLIEHPQLWDKLVPMAFHVDYWDYLGWQDPYAQSQFSQRQRLLKQKGQIKAVYTPGWVVDGQEWRGFFRGRPLPSQQTRDGGVLKAKRNGQQLMIDYQPASAPKGSLTAHVSILGFDLHSDIARGENRGLSLEHQFVVLDKQLMKGDGVWSFQLPALASNGNGRKALVVWIDQPGMSQPMQVVAGWLE